MGAHQYVCAGKSKWQPISAMARIVMKFGGTSVADLDRIRNVVQRIKREVDFGNQVAVVVSAMSGVTINWSSGAPNYLRCTMRANTMPSSPPASR